MVLNISWIATIGSSIAIIAAVAIVVVTVLSSENKWGGLASGLYNLYGISGYVADVVSYTRLMALAVSGGKYRECVQYVGRIPSTSCTFHSRYFLNRSLTRVEYFPFIPWSLRFTAYVYSSLNSLVNSTTAADTH